MTTQLTPAGAPSFSLGFVPGVSQAPVNAPAPSTPPILSMSTAGGTAVEPGAAGAAASTAAVAAAPAVLAASAAVEPGCTSAAAAALLGPALLSAPVAVQRGGTIATASAPALLTAPILIAAAAVGAAGRLVLVAERLPVTLGPAERQSCENGFVQRSLWPLFHDLAPLASFELADWQAFRAVNRKFARAAARAVATPGGGPGRPLARALTPGNLPGSPAGLVFAHDPLLMGLAAELRRLRAPVETVYFLRLPFPAPDMLLRLPWRDHLLAGLLAFDRLGFQTRRDLGNFLDCIQLVFGEVVARRGAGGAWRLTGRAGDRSCALSAGVYPEGVDAAGIARAAASAEVERRLRALREAGVGGTGGGGDGIGARGDHRSAGGRRRCQWVLAIDTVSPEEGTPEKLRAFAAALDLRPALREQASLLLVLEAGRSAGPAAAATRRREIERQVGEINGRLGRAGWVPIRYRFQELEAAERLALYRAADVAMVTPLRAGMGLAAKQYCAADLDERGALVLSEFAGAADQLGGGALLVNPHDVGAVARVLTAALRAGADERRRRMRRLRDEVRAHDVSWWARELLPEMQAA